MFLYLISILLILPGFTFYGVLFQRHIIDPWKIYLVFVWFLIKLGFT